MENRIAYSVADQEITSMFQALDDNAQVFLYEILKGLTNGLTMEMMLAREAKDYDAVMSMTTLEEYVSATPLATYIQHRWGTGGDIITPVVMAYRLGIADGKRLDRARRATRKKVSA